MVVNVKKQINIFISAITLLFLSQSVNAAITLDRTRAIFFESDGALTISISNENKKLPYLAQVWIENEKQEKITTGPIVVTPPLQRLEPQKKSMVFISATPDAKKLPQDRESLFYFNLREIPPKSDKKNVLQIALQTKIKLFYRPESLSTRPDEIWQDNLILYKVSNGFRIKNPTPYYVTIIGFGVNEKQSKEGKFESIMLSPYSEHVLKAGDGDYKSPWLTYINDYGGRPSIQFNCFERRCTVNKQ